MQRKTELARGIQEYPAREAAAAFSDRELLERLVAEDARVFVVETSDRAVRDAVERILALLPDLVADRREALTRERLEQLIGLLTPEAGQDRTDLRIARDNAALRQRFLEAEPCLTSRQVHDLAGAKGRNVSQTASAWKRRGYVFSVPHNGRDLYPAFQFADGRPHPTMAKVLAALPEGMSPWQTAFWFVTGNGWLGGAEPKDMLDRPDDLVAAAHRERRDVVG